MVCSDCSRSFDGNSRFCTCCGRPLQSTANYPAAPLLRVREGRMIAGVCAGFARAYRLDVTVTRLVVCLLGLLSVGTVFVAYLIAWIVMPQAPYVFSTVPADIVTP